MTWGASLMCQAPNPPMTRNQTSIVGPKMPPMALVPLNWKAKRPTRITAEMKGTLWAKLGSKVFKPSTAPSTEIAGVMMPSP